MGALFVLLAFAITACLSNHLIAQELSATKGGLGGAITDKSGAVIPAAQVRVVGDADQRVAIADSSGRFTIIGLTPGQYTVMVEAKGFKSTQAKNVDVVINRVSNLNITLEVGQVSETVEVSANSVEVDTNSTAVGDNLTSSFYQQVPTARNVGSLFYTSPGVVDGGGTGTANPSIGGATGLENEYIADGVGINDSGFGGIGVWSYNYGSLGTGINLTFVQEVQVKTGAFEPKYGKADGGVVQIVTKSGGSQYHGALAAYFAPQGFFAGFRNPDSFRMGSDISPSFLRGHNFSYPAYDASAELGGYIPVLHHNDKLFFFAAYNPSLSQTFYLAPNTAFSSLLYNHGPYATSITNNSWAGKLTYKVTDSTSLEASSFGDPSRSNFAFGQASTSPSDYPDTLNLKNTTSFSRWNYGTRSVVARLTSSINATTQLNMSATYKTSHFTESGFANDYQITDKTTGSTGFQGLGYFQNPLNQGYGFNIDLQKTVNLHGSHTFSVGWGFDRAIFDANRDYSGPRVPFPASNADGISVAAIGGSTGLIGAPTSAAFYLSNAPAACPLAFCPLYAAADGTDHHVYLRQVRGVYSAVKVNSSQGYHAIYGNDNYSINRYVTINAGLRWEQEVLSGPNQSYVFNRNWSPRLGINVDPFGDRKSKVFFNWGRYTQALPTDAAIRELNQELDVNSARWAAPQDANHRLLLAADGSIQPVLDAAHLLNGVAGTGYDTVNITASPSTLELIQPRTKLNFEEEYLLGVERQFGGFVVSARYSDRRLLRIVEDMQGVSPEAASGQTNDTLLNQIYTIGNPGPGADYFVNEAEETYDPNGPVPADCTADYGVQEDSLGNVVGAACATNAQPNSAQNPYTGPGDPVNSPGWVRPDGKPDGFAVPVRRYQALEVEVNKNFSHNFLLRANYRYAKLFGNYEGLFRNDNGQSDPGISSLFDFTTGKLGLLGAQFLPGYLNEDRRNIGNIFGSYVFPGGFVKGLTLGMGLRGQSGIPINKLASHPAYTDTGEIPIGGRGAAGREASSLQLDLHTDYGHALTDRFRLKLGFDTFNVTNSKYTLNKNQNIDTGFLSGADPTFLTPTKIQRPFYGRGSIRLEF
jgi:hypothetical protein